MGMHPAQLRACAPSTGRRCSIHSRHTANLAAACQFGMAVQIIATFCFTRFSSQHLQCTSWQWRCRPPALHCPISSLPSAADPRSALFYSERQHHAGGTYLGYTTPTAGPKPEQKCRRTSQVPQEPLLHDVGIVTPHLLATCTSETFGVTSVAMAPEVCLHIE